MGTILGSPIFEKETLRTGHILADICLLQELLERTQLSRTTPKLSGMSRYAVLEPKGATRPSSRAPNDDVRLGSEVYSHATLGPQTRNPKLSLSLGLAWTLAVLLQGWIHGSDSYLVLLFRVVKAIFISDYHVGARQGAEFQFAWFGRHTNLWDLPIY